VFEDKHKETKRKNPLQNRWLNWSCSAPTVPKQHTQNQKPVTCFPYKRFQHTTSRKPGALVFSFFFFFFNTGSFSWTQTLFSDYVAIRPHSDTSTWMPRASSFLLKIWIHLQSCSNIFLFSVDTCNIFFKGLFCPRFAFNRT